MTPREYAGWLADKIHPYGDYAKEAAAVLIRQAEEIDDLSEALSACVESLRGYRREMNDGQPCDAEKIATALLMGLNAKCGT